MELAVSESSVTVSSPNVSKFSAWFYLSLCQLNRTKVWRTSKSAELDLRESLPVQSNRKDRCGPRWEKGLGPLFPSQVIWRWGMWQTEGEGLGWKHTKWPERGLKGTEDSHWSETGFFKATDAFYVTKVGLRGSLGKKTTAVKSHSSGDKVWLTKRQLCQMGGGLPSGRLQGLQASGGKHSWPTFTLPRDAALDSEVAGAVGGVTVTSWQPKERETDLWPESWPHATVKSKGLSLTEGGGLRALSSGKSGSSFSLCCLCTSWYHRYTLGSVEMPGCNWFTFQPPPRSSLPSLETVPCSPCLPRTP